MIPPEFRGLAELARATLHEPASVEVLPGDVGRRRYLRLVLGGGETVLGVVYTPEEADSRSRWVAARVVLEERLRVPRLLERPSERPAWLSKAAAAAAVLAEMADPEINPAFDAAFFRRELELAREAVFDLYLRAPLSAVERAAHDAWADALCREIADHPRALCHRDYHGNNLFPMEAGVGWIDFQDLRAGPDSYDLASLLWERTTLDWMGQDLAEAIVEEFARARGIRARDLRARFDRVLLQRAWKVCGTFARAVAQGRGETYRRYLPGEMALVGRLLGNSAEDRRFRRLFETRLAPLC